MDAAKELEGWQEYTPPSCMKSQCKQSVAITGINFECLIYVSKISYRWLSFRN